MKSLEKGFRHLSREDKLKQLLKRLHNCYILRVKSVIFIVYH